MSLKVHVPTLGESVLEAVVGKWYVQPGEYVEKDALLVEVETDKVTLEVVATISGQITNHITPTGATVKPDDVMTEIVESEAHKISSEKEEAHPKPEKVDAKQTSVEAKEPEREKKPAPAEENKDQQPQETLPDEPVNIDSGKEVRVPMSPMRKRIAQRLKESQNTAATLTTFNEIDLSAIKKLREQYQKAFTEK